MSLLPRPSRDRLRCPAVEENIRLPTQHLVPAHSLTRKFGGGGGGNGGGGQDHIYKIGTPQQEHHQQQQHHHHQKQHWSADSRKITLTSAECAD